MMKRRDFVALLGGAVAAWPLAARAQPGALPTVGILLVFSREAARTFTDPIRTYMQALGYVEGHNIVFDFRFADGKLDRLPALAADLAGHRPAVIATFGDAAGLAAKAATATIPIVAMSEDLVRAALVANMRQPAGNITGVSIMGTELDAKRLEGLSELLPARSPVLLLGDPTTHRESRPALEATAAARRQCANCQAVQARLRHRPASRASRRSRCHPLRLQHVRLRAGCRDRASPPRRSGPARALRLRESRSRSHSGNSPFARHCRR